MRERVIPLDIGVRWEPNAPEASLRVNDNGSASLSLCPHPDDPDQTRVVIHWSGVWHSSMGYPNDEGLIKHRLYKLGLSTISWIGVVVDSDLAQNLLEARMISTSKLTHYIVLTKERIVEVVAESISKGREA